MPFNVKVKKTEIYEQLPGKKVTAFCSFRLNNTFNNKV